MKYLIIFYFCFGTWFLTTHTPGKDSLDVRLWYQPEDINFLFTQLNELGRKQYILHELFDLSYILTYSFLIIFYFQIISNSKFQTFTRSLKCIVLLPGILDILETLGIIFLLYTFPYMPNAIALSVCYLTLFKWFAGVLVFIIVGIKIYTRVAN